MQKIDYKKNHSPFYKPRKNSLEIIKVPKLNYLMIDGEGNPNTSKSYSEAVQTLYPIAYTIKFMIKKGPLQTDYGVMPLEGLWWADNMDDFIEGNKENWKWTMMIMQPEIVTQAIVDEAMRTVREKKALAAIDKIRFETFAEGTVGQTLHIGPFTEEGPTIEKLHHFIEDQGYALSGKHHEIYLSDIRKAAPENWKTILRQPCKKIKP